MIRKAFVLQIYPGMETEFVRRHHPIWAEFATVLRAHGAHNYSLFIHPETLQVFGYVEIESEARWNAIAHTEVGQRWWLSMKDLLPTEPDNCPTTAPLLEVFHLFRS